MRVLTVCFLLFSLAYAWSAVDHEIFEVVDNLRSLLKNKKSFYEVLEVSPSATAKQINRAFRAKSRVYHPDKNKKTRDIYTQLNLAVNILRKPEARKRYDHFLKNGFPKWKGTAYLYSRYRPGLGSALFVIFLGISVAHFVFIKLSAHQQRKSIQRHIDDAKNNQRNAVAGTFNKKIVQVPETGRLYTVDTITGQVCVFDPQRNEEYLLSVDAIPKVTFSDSLLVKLPRAIFHLITFNAFRRKPVEKSESAELELTSESDEVSSENEIENEGAKSSSASVHAVKIGNRRVQRRMRRAQAKENAKK
ncbi:DNAJ domain-containing protein Erj5 [Schizosaccharomyces japonicus yFS275]|uniref:DNAJ domain-containing protein Erj5 n=1 Tax=Schizosaccharomyces japonicus (strain yFS275 / FY16936) TaxID=402676 RepID=B6K348_SCHJY|nr:DNAJ domain-containing protein Erj5 [Schizosaccharomyces japonicus yFS275]EEB07905.1 DNAJ domain-containing protein Erj5 [Schizosaccharomyces japonicus yFS275]